MCPKVLLWARAHRHPLLQYKQKKYLKSSKKSEFFWQQTLTYFSHAYKFSWQNDIHAGLSKKNKIDAPKCFQKQFFWSMILFFCWHLHKCHFITKIGTHVEKTSKFLDKKIQIFLNFFTIFSDFTVHPGSLVPGINSSTSAYTSQLPMAATAK